MSDEHRPAPPTTVERDAGDPERDSRTGGDDREGATEKQVGDRTGPGAGYDKEPEKEQDKGGVTPS